MFNTTRRYGLSATESEEVVQQTMIRLTRSLPTFKYDSQKGSFKAWLRTQVRWNILDLLKQRKSLEPLSDQLIPDQGVDTFEQEWDAEWKRFVFDRAFKSLKKTESPHCVQIYHTAVLKGMGIAETARTLRTSKLAVHLALFKARKHLRQEISKLEQSGGL